MELLPASLSTLVKLATLELSTAVRVSLPESAESEQSSSGGLSLFRKMAVERRKKQPKVKNWV
jgi:hypothetical protein